MKTHPNSASLMKNAMSDFTDLPALTTSGDAAWDVLTPAENNSLPQIDPVLPPEPRSAMQWFFSKKTELRRLEAEHQRLTQQAELAKAALRAVHEQKLRRLEVAAEALRGVLAHVERTAADRRCSMVDVRQMLRDFSQRARDPRTPIEEKRLCQGTLTTLSLRLVELDRHSVMTLSTVFSSFGQPALLGTVDGSSPAQLKEQF